MQTLKVKALTVFMSIVMVFSMFPALSSNAATYDIGTGITYTLSNGVLTINGKGAMRNFTNTADIPWFTNRGSVKKIVINDGITHIGDAAFYDCHSATEIVWPTTGCVKSIGLCSFNQCSSLTKIVVPQGVTYVGTEAFYKCRAATSVSLPSTLKTIAYGAFADCDLRSVYLPGSVTSIGNFSFRGNYKMTKFSGGAGLVSIGLQSFEFCYDLKSFTITSKKLKKIGKSCFLCCSKLKTINIKKTTKLTKKGVKGSLYLSSVKKVKVKKSKVKKYKKFFTYRNCYKRGVKVKK